MSYSIIGTSDINWYAERDPFTVVDHNGREKGHFPTRDQASQYIEQLIWYEALPVGQRTSNLLINARSVCSKARTSRAYAESYGNQNRTAEEHAILDDLRKVEAILDRWDRTGSTPKYTGATDGYSRQLWD